MRDVTISRSVLNKNTSKNTNTGDVRTTMNTNTNTGAVNNNNSAKNSNTINLRVVIEDTKKKKKPESKRSSPSAGDDSAPPPPPNNYIIQPSAQPQMQATSYPDPPLPRSGASMMNRPYDVADAAVGTENEAMPEGLASNFAAYEERRRAVIQALEQELNDAMEWGPDPAAPGPAMSDSTDRTVAPSEADFGVQHGGQIDNGPNWYNNDTFEIPHATPDSIQYPEDDPETLPVRHRSEGFAQPPTQQLLALPAPPTQPAGTDETETPTPSDLPGPSRGRASTRGRGSERVMSNAAYRAAMIDDGWLPPSGKNATEKLRREYQAFLDGGRNANIRPSWESQSK
jgi:hypothetical protein